MSSLSAARRATLFRKRYPAAVYEKKEEHYDNDLATHYEIIRHRAHPIEVAGDHPTMLLKINIDDVSDMARSIVERYTRAEIDSVYVVYNEFKSVISQRVVVEKLLPIRKLGSHEITVAEEMTEEQIEAAGHAAKTAGISLTPPEESVIRIRSEEVRHRRGRLHLRSVAGAIVPPPDAKVRHDADLPCVAGDPSRRSTQRA